MSGADRFANPTSYHRVYRAPKPWLNFSTISAAAVALGSAVGLWFAATAPMQGTTERSIWVSLCLVFLGLGAFVVLSIVLQRVVLHPDRIEVHALGTTRSLRREEIRGWRSTGTSPVVIILEPKDRDRKAVGFTLWFPLDEELQGWLDAVPCLN